ncbi:hypothetical protein EVAR_82715_1 [Eumeta japonica]|uniref:Reverse transcriptase domain-containing protein n=1 Tax=Eumeta variegata TaxID=151549 RepID=A0A4C1YCR0_EUMVA|nr:hypothetical protein EVAR_82715_1 [Eumeta japonica]
MVSFFDSVLGLRGVRQGCVASLWLFILLMDNCLYDLKENERGLRMDEQSAKCLLYADDQVFRVPSACGPQEMVNKMKDSVKKRGIKGNVGKTKVIVFEKGESMTECDIFIKGEKAEQVKEFVYLGSLFKNDVKYDRDIGSRANAGNKVNGALLAIINSKSVSRQGRLSIHNGVLIPTLMYGSESWVWQTNNESRINAVEMRSLRSMCGVSRKDICRNSDVRERNLTDILREGYLSTATIEDRISAQRLMIETDKRVTYQQIWTSIGMS